MKEGGDKPTIWDKKNKNNPKTTLCAHHQDYHLVWFLVLCLAGALIHTLPIDIHTYIHTSSNCCFQSHAPMVFFCVFQNKYSHGFNAAEMQGGESEALLIARYVCMYVCIHSNTPNRLGRYANSYNSCMIQYQPLKPQ